MCLGISSAGLWESSLIKWIHEEMGVGSSGGWFVVNGFVWGVFVPIWGIKIILAGGGGNRAIAGREQAAVKR